MGEADSSGQLHSHAITLDAAGGGQNYAVGEGRLILLNNDGTRPEGAASNRVLMRVEAAVLDRG